MDWILDSIVLEIRTPHDTMAMTYTYYFSKHTYMLYVTLRAGTEDRVYQTIIYPGWASKLRLQT